ncbi:MAG: glycosyltransferase family 1 protein [Sphingobacteriaceae bacterium]|nr:MAG: glycosyltransferase family 1 protein [Sphingobacteriaceae bacterium]
MKIIHLQFRTPPRTDRFITGDRYLISLAKSILSVKKISGIKKVFVNLCKGFDELNVAYTINRPFHKIKHGEPVVVLGDGRYALQGYDIPNPIIAGIGLMTHPAQWPNFFKEYPVAKYLQHSQWTNNIYRPYFGDDNCEVWPAGIDTDHWAPNTNIKKEYDFLVYDKVMWPKNNDLVTSITHKLDATGHTCRVIKYGSYIEKDYFNLLQQSKAMIFLCEHESQGFACCEALSANVPVFAWDQGRWLDPNRFEWNSPETKATSIPFFDERCGESFVDMDDFTAKIEAFWEKCISGAFNPRAYVLENLTLKKSAERMLEIINSVYK